MMKEDELIAELSPYLNDALISSYAYDLQVPGRNSEPRLLDGA